MNVWMFVYEFECSVAAENPKAESLYSGIQRGHAEINAEKIMLKTTSQPIVRLHRERRFCLTMRLGNTQW